MCFFLEVHSKAVRKSLLSGASQFDDVLANITLVKSDEKS